VNCAVGPVERLEAELFGVDASGAGAQRRERPGALDEAARGTVYLDELEAMPLSAQARLVQALEDQEYLRLGATAPTRLSARLIAAAVDDPARLVALGRFRADLYDRLRVVTITIPPLRERRQEIAELVGLLMDRYATQYRGGPVRLRPETLQRLVDHSWPGNIPQLENVVERIVLNGTDHWVADELDAAASDAPGARRDPAPRPDGFAGHAPESSAR
jgi:transcriptional regulator with PAS, ATPase and Fis domain